jgi:hypothetical protein
MTEPTPLYDQVIKSFHATEQNTHAAPTRAELLQIAQIKALFAIGQAIEAVSNAL